MGERKRGFSVIFLSRLQGNKPTWPGEEKCFPEPADRSILVAGLLSVPLRQRPLPQDL